MATQVPENDTNPSFRSRALRDMEDLNLEIAGQNAARPSRFLTGDAAPRAVEDRKKKEDERRFQSLLEMLLRDDPRYAKLYRDTTERLEKARQAVDSALLDIKQRHEAAVAQLQKLRESAVSFPDGTRVFRSSTDNGIYTETGQRLSEADAQKVVIPSDAPSWEDFKTAREEQERLEQGREETVRYRDEVLKPAQDRLNDPDDPPSLDELEDIQHRVLRSAPQAVAARMPAAASSAASGSTISVAQAEVGATRLDVPDLRETFGAATAGPPSDASLQLPPPIQASTPRLK